MAKFEQKNPDKGLLFVDDELWTLRAGETSRRSFRTRLARAGRGLQDQPLPVYRGRPGDPLRQPEVPVLSLPLSASASGL